MNVEPNALYTYCVSLSNRIIRYTERAKNINYFTNNFAKGKKLTFSYIGAREFAKPKRYAYSRLKSTKKLARKMCKYANLYVH